MREIYLDNSATTPTDPDTAAVALDVMTRNFGNPSSLHKKGLEAEERLTQARRRLADALGCAPAEVYFTSGGTESNNLAIQGAWAAHRRRASKLIATQVEHASVLEPLRQLAERQGAQAVFVPPAPDGAADVDKLAAEVDENTLLVSCNLVNSEVGAVSDIVRLVRLVKAKSPKTLVHCDAVQGFGKRPVSVRELGVDLLSVSGHKLHAPKGVGALYVKKGVRVLPLVYGGGQEKNLRPGTENVPLACAFGHAAEKASRDLSQIQEHFQTLRGHFVNKAEQMLALCINSPPGGAPNICNVSATGWRSETLLHFLADRGIYVSSGSACSKGADSHVLAAMGLPRERIQSALRISFSRHNTIEDVDDFFAALTQGLQTIARSN